jgi:ELWxxDGT repeat protein
MPVTSFIDDPADGLGVETQTNGAMVNMNGTLFFAGNDGVHGVQIWKSDGTAAGTVMLTDTNPTTAGLNASDLTEVNGTLFFIASDPLHGTQLWKSDGTGTGKFGSPISTRREPDFLKSKI